MTRTTVAVLLTVAGLSAVASFAEAAELAGRYAIVVRKDVAAGSWGKVVRALEEKHGGKTFSYDTSLQEVVKDVGVFHPRYVCFVCPPIENFPEFVPVANKFCRNLDGDPYVDAIWGILTGYDEDHALDLVKAEPVVVKRVFTKTLGSWLNWVPEGEYVTEWTRDRGEVGQKKRDAQFTITSGGPRNDEEDLKYVHKLLSQDSFDMIIGSGHGDHHNWMLMYPSGKSLLTAKDGQLSMTAPGLELPLTASRPKLYWAVGNCLTGVVNTKGHSFKNSYALAWMNNGARQYIGAVQPTWYELNWNMADWFLKQEGRWTFSESLFLLRQWSQYLLNEKIVSGNDRKGTEYTDEIFVLYGDPAFAGRVEKSREPALTESLDVQETAEKDTVRMTYKVKVNFVGEGNKRTAEKYDGWRIFSYLLPYQVADVKVEKTDFAKVVVPGETILWDAGTGLKVGDERSVTFTARRETLAPAEPANKASDRPSNVMWRYDGSGRFPNIQPPREWQADKNILWTTPVEVGGYSSPIVAADKVFVTAEMGSLFCLNFTDGRVLWSKDLFSKESKDLPPELSRKLMRGCGGDSKQSTPTPASNGKLVFYINAMGLCACYDMQGRQQWIQIIETAEEEEYFSSSPIFAGDRILVTWGCLMALDAATGKTLWKADDAKPTHGTPLITRIGGVEVIITPAGDVVRSEDGEILCSGLFESTFTTPLIDRNILYVIDNRAKALELPDRAEMGMQLKELWNTKLRGTYMASPVCRDGLIYTMESQKCRVCILDATTGALLSTTKQVDEETKAEKIEPGVKIEGLSRAQFAYASPVATEHEIYFFDDGGNTAVMPLGSGHPVARINKLNDTLIGTPFFVKDKIIIRGRETVYCVGKTP